MELPPQKPTPWVLSLLRGLDEELIEEYLPQVVSRISRSFSEKTPAPEDTFVYGGSADQELVDDEDNAIESDDFFRIISKRKGGSSMNPHYQLYYLIGPQEARLLLSE